MSFKYGDVVKRKEGMWEGIQPTALEPFDAFTVSAYFADQQYPTVIFKETGGYQWDAAYFELVGEPRFSIGDRVISVKNTPFVEEGFIGTVSKIFHNGSCPISVRSEVNENSIWCFEEDELELLTVGYGKREDGFIPKTAIQPEYTGGSSSYYKVDVINPTTSDAPYQAECNDVIEALGLTFTEGNIFKAIWRIAADRNGKKKKGNNSVYDAEKVVFFAERLLIQEKSKEGK